MEDNGEDKDEAKRRTRNLSEKKRRDQFILLINELSAMVSTNSRKMDKCTVLKATISFLKNHNEITIKSRAHDIREEWKPSFLSNEEFKYLVLEALEGFVMVISTSGQIYYVSESITTLLGYDTVEIINKNIFEIICEEEHVNMYNILQNSPTVDQAQVGEREGEISFQCHFKRAQEIDDLATDAVYYELIQFNGRFRPIIEQVRSDDSQSYQNIEAGKLFVCTGRLCMPQLINNVSLVDTSQNEFTSRHSLEWKFLFLDHRAPPIIGYLPFEVLGTSGYDYYHFDDLEKIIRCHELLMTKGDITSCYYRFLTKGQQWIWLQSRFYISYHQWNSKPEFVVCTHRVVSRADIEQSMKQENQVEREPHLNNSQRLMKEDTNDETLSNQYVADNNAYANTYCDVSQGCSKKLASSADSTVETIATTGSSATSRSWPRFRAQYKAPDSDTASTSSDIYPIRNTSHQMLNDMEGASGGSSVISYVETTPCVPVTTLLPLPIHQLPVIVASDPAQLQLNFPKAPVTCDRSDDQLHKKHEELEQMIVQQQEELRQVKEQLLLARLGILQPFINVQNLYVNPEEIQQTQRVQPSNVVYEAAMPRPEEQYIAPHQPSEHNTQHRDHVD